MAKAIKSSDGVNPGSTDLALRICACTGMGLTVCRERMAAFGDDARLIELLDSKDTPTLEALLNPSNKAV